MTFRRLALASTACAVACGRPAPRAARPSLVTITATDYAFGMPDTIPAGLTTFRLVNQGKELHHASLVRLGAGKSAALPGRARGRDEEPRAAAVLDDVPRRTQRRDPRRHRHRHPDARARVVRARVLDSQ